MRGLSPTTWPAERNLKLQALDIDSDAVAAIERSASGNGPDERSQERFRLEDAVELTKARVGVLSERVG